ncbi:hypothetical protein [Coleofasciculus sp. E1-EBD-02]|uniref:hypothetical protein n=1 Tax=Coleofasciculus sp. E1-EBD-02 TaxID=3068481 RepID=UPI0032FC7F60
MNDENFCKNNINIMLKRSQTKVIFPVITLALVKEYLSNQKTIFSNSEIKAAYQRTVNDMIDYLQHDLHIGGKYYDAYPSRNLPKYGVLRVINSGEYEFMSPYTNNAKLLDQWIPEIIQQHISSKLGKIPRLSNREVRAELSLHNHQFIDFIEENICRNSTNFEIFSFAVIKVHLEKFSCRLYRDTRTSANDSGVDISTNFGVVYQIKKLKVYSKAVADDIYAELKGNFDRERLSDGNVILIIDDISKDIKSYLINMKVQSITIKEILKLASQFEDMEDREKILRIIYEEFHREYSSNIR